MSEGKLVICCAGGADGVDGADVAAAVERWRRCGDCKAIMEFVFVVMDITSRYLRVEIIVDGVRRSSAVEEITHGAARRFRTADEVKWRRAKDVANLCMAADRMIIIANRYLFELHSTDPSPR